MNPWTMKKEAVSQAASVLINHERKMVEAVGLFLKWYAEVEHQIDRLIVHVLQMANFEHYDILAKNVAVRAKIDMLRNSVDSRDAKIGEQLGKRLTYFNESCRERRNAISHGRLSGNSNGVVSQTVGRMGDKPKNSVRPRNLKPKVISYNHLYKHVFWMKDLRDDLETLAVSIYGKPLSVVLDIDHPVSTMQPAILSVHKGPTTSLATTRKPQKSPGAKP